MANPPFCSLDGDGGDADANPWQKRLEGAGMGAKLVNQ
jgi:hypothetical protein